MSDVPKSCPVCRADMRWTVLGAMCSEAVLHPLYERSAAVTRAEHQAENESMGRDYQGYAERKPQDRRTGE